MRSVEEEHHFDNRHCLFQALFRRQHSSWLISNRRGPQREHRKPHIFFRFDPTLSLAILIQKLVYGWRIYDYIAYQNYRFSVRQHRWMMKNETLDESIAEPMQTLDLLCFSSQVRLPTTRGILYDQHGSI